MSVRHRAVRDDQKQERRAAILRVAWQLFQGLPYQQIAMSEVAERAGVAKGTLYLYFKTKEELFLSILAQQLESWFGEIDSGLRDQRRGSRIPQIAQLVCGALVGRPGLTRLLAMLHNILEQNIDLETTRRFKRMLLEHMSRTGALLEACLPFLKPGEGARVLLRAQALIIGLWQLADPAPSARQLLADPDMAPLAVDFESEFLPAFTALLLGLERMSEQPA